jgi:LPXTG-site transpeptidase (sortase) family protein
VNARPSIAKRRRNWRRSFFRGAYYCFLAFAFLALGYTTYIFVDARAYQAFEEQKFYNRRATPGPHLVATGDAIGEMKIPRIGLKTIVVQGESARILHRAVGHLPETAMPGEPGNVALAGHRDDFFRPLKDIQVGDAISLNTLDGEFGCRVESAEAAWPSDVQVLQPTGENTLTLLTCYRFYYVGSAPKRFIVRARQIGRLPLESLVAEAAHRF